MHPGLGLFHFAADIKGRSAAVILDDYSLINLVSIEVVEKLQLITCSKTLPYTLAAYCDETFPITHVAYVPITIYGYTVSICCDVIPRALNCCNTPLL